MAVTYDQVRQVIALPPDRRRDFDVNSLLPWFQKRSYVFKNLKTKLLFDVIKNLQLIRVDQDEIIIRQGDKGDCMYIILGGQVTIYNNDAKRMDDDGAATGPSISSVSANNKEILRQQLGNFVITLKSGSAFGEVALMSDDCIRSATVITDVPSDLMVIDRELYNRSIKSVLKAEFDQKANFIEGNPNFNKWNAKYKKQLTMALEKETLPYESVLTKQGNRIEAIYFILTGEVKVLMDTDQHGIQYPNLYSASNYSSILDSCSDEDPPLARMSVSSFDNSGSSKKSSRKGQKIEVCLLGVNEAIGDVEVLLGLNTYMQTCICTQPTEVLVMGMKHYERLLIRRNPRTISAMKAGLGLKINSRIANCRTSQIPLLSCLSSQADLFSASLRQHDPAQRGTFSDKQPKPKKRELPKDAAESSHTHRTLTHIPGNTPIDTSRKISKRIDFKSDSSQHQVILTNEASNRTRLESNGRELDASKSTKAILNGQDKTSRESTKVIQNSHSDSAALEHLETKISKWLTGDSFIKNNVASKRNATPRIIKLHRTETELEQMKPGAKILVRPKKQPEQPYDGKDYDTDKKSSTVAELAYYKMALTASIPTFEILNEETT